MDKIMAYIQLCNSGQSDSESTQLTNFYLRTADLKNKPSSLILISEKIRQI